MPSNPDWIDIPRYEIEINGLDGSSIKFVSYSVLSKRVLKTGVVSFSAHLILKTNRAAFQQEFGFSDYHGIGRFHDGLLAIRRGTATEASLTGAGFSLTIISRELIHAPRLFVEGFFSSIQDLKYTPWPVRKSIDKVAFLNEDSAACIRFAFLSSCVDPPYLDKAIHGFGALIEFLKSEGYEP